MNGADFVESVIEKLVPVTPIAKSIIEKQMNDLGLSKDIMSPRQAEMLIRRTVEALKLFIGPSGAEMAKSVMMKELRKRAPDYFTAQGL